MKLQMLLLLSSMLHPVLGDGSPRPLRMIDRAIRDTINRVLDSADQQCTPVEGKQDKDTKMTGANQQMED